MNLDNAILTGQILIILAIGAWWLWGVHRIQKCPWVKECNCQGRGAPPTWDKR